MSCKKKYHELKDKQPPWHSYLEIETATKMREGFWTCLRICVPSFSFLTPYILLTSTYPYSHYLCSVKTNLFLSSPVFTHALLAQCILDFLTKISHRNFDQTHFLMFRTWHLDVTPLSCLHHSPPSTNLNSGCPLRFLHFSHFISNWLLNLVVSTPSWLLFCYRLSSLGSRFCFESTSVGRRGRK